jgi:hypothetical protein
VKTYTAFGVKMPPGIEVVGPYEVRGQERKVAWIVNCTTGRLFAHRIEFSNLVQLSHSEVLKDFVRGQVMQFGMLLMRNEAIEVDDCGELP